MRNAFQGSTRQGINRDVRKLLDHRAILPAGFRRDVDISRNVTSPHSKMAMTFSTQISCAGGGVGVSRKPLRTTSWDESSWPFHRRSPGCKVQTTQAVHFERISSFSSLRIQSRDSGPDCEFRRDGSAPPSGGHRSPTLFHSPPLDTLKTASVRRDGNARHRDSKRKSD